MSFKLFNRKHKIKLCKVFRRAVDTISSDIILHPKILYTGKFKVSATSLYFTVMDNKYGSEQDVFHISRCKDFSISCQVSSSVSHSPTLEATHLVNDSLWLVHHARDYDTVNINKLFKYNRPHLRDILSCFLLWNQPWTWALILIHQHQPLGTRLAWLLVRAGWEGMFCKFIFQKHFFIVHWSHITVGWGIMFSNDLDISDIYPGCPPLQPSILGKCNCFRESPLLSSPLLCSGVWCMSSEPSVDSVECQAWPDRTN